ncbi:hypothetical protein [Marinilabilia salmonicolor]|uniref:Uncharacterized protein n=1 Tax=Marinilabilia salmonicolor TaxID=989 RepID=A0A368UR67_9BACT|nr:hypothetical protein [Marinilabilia salmonicolor]RCW31286.1 hypothetical protein DFO77_1182 [Marinilabilia salmonicolor]
MLSKATFLISTLFWMIAGQPSSGQVKDLTDADIRHFMRTLPRMIPQLRETEITINEAYYIWPRDASLDARGAILLEDYGYDALRLEALETFCKTWFCLHYDSLLTQRQQILMSNEEQLTENPYISDDQKRINIRILNKELGQNKEKLQESVGESNLQIVETYCPEIRDMWEKVSEEE